MSIEDIQAAFLAAETVPPADMEGDGAPPAPMPGEDAPEARAALFPLNDYGNGQRLVEYYGGDMLFVPRLGWYRWSGKHWCADEDELDVRRDAQKIGGRILGELPFVALEEWQAHQLEVWREVKREFVALDKKKADERSDEEKARHKELVKIQEAGVAAENLLKTLRGDHRKHAKSSGNTSKISNMLAEAKTAVSTTVGALNSDPLMVGCENGVLRFVQRADSHDAAWGDARQTWHADLLPHDRSQLISKLAAAEYDPAATCPAFDGFLEVVQPDADVRAFLQRWFGYNLTGLTVEQQLAFFYGGGRNGKSTLVDVIAKIFADYGTTIPIETLTGTEQRKGSDATPDLVRLPGARLVRASEPEQGQRMKEALIKALTGGEAIMIRRMQQEFVEVVPEFKLTISGNHKPDIRGGDDGIWRRVLLVPWLVQIPEAEVDRGLPGKLWAERAGILAWMVRGCISYLETGLRPPAAVIEATEEYRQESDPMRVFLTGECIITGSPDDFETGRDLADAFNAWLLWRGEAAWGKRTAANTLKARAGTMKGPEGQIYAPSKRSDTGYLGIQLKEAARDRIAAYGDDLRAAAARKG